MPSASDLPRGFHASGDRGAPALLFERHRGLAFRVALDVVGNPTDAEDATQNAFVPLTLPSPPAPR